MSESSEPKRDREPLTPEEARQAREGFRLLISVLSGAVVREPGVPGPPRPNNVARQIRREEFVGAALGEARTMENLRWRLDQIAADQDALREDVGEVLKMLDWLREDVKLAERYLRRLKRQQPEGESTTDESASEETTNARG